MSNQWADFELFKENPVIISPNIGFPLIISMDGEASKSKKKSLSRKFTIKITAVGNENYSCSDLKSYFSESIYLRPLYSHDPESSRLVRGRKLMVKVINLERISSLPLGNTNLKDLYGISEKKSCYIIRHEIFGKNQALFQLSCEFDIFQEEEIQDWLLTHSFLMFDLEQYFKKLSEKIVRICYHSIVVRSVGWKNIKFAQISDLHVAKRFDELLGMISPKVLLNFELRIFEKTQGKPLINRYENPNNYLRRFILWANQAAERKGLDFVVATGDLIDYYLKNTIPKMKDFTLQESNWDVFLRIILNQPIEYRRGCPILNIVENEELAVPIFTQTGNHDVRVNGYPLKLSAGIYRNFGLTLSEAAQYSDPFRRRQFASLIIDKYCLKPYYQFINPYDDYAFKLGNHGFIFLNSGEDTMLSFSSLLMADPKSVGFSNKQVFFMKSIAKMYSFKELSERPDANIFLLSHAPVINSSVKKILYRNLLSKVKLRKLEQPEVHKGLEYGRGLVGNRKGWRFLRYDYGTIYRNRLNTMAFMFAYRIIGLHGHSHRTREFFYIFASRNFRLKKKSNEIDNDPFEIYWDDFSKKFPSQFIRKNKHFDLQSPSLGIGRFNDHSEAGKFRFIVIKNNKLEEFPIKSLNLLQKMKHIEYINTYIRRR